MGVNQIICLSSEADVPTLIRHVNAENNRFQFRKVSTGWNEKREFVGPTYYFTDGNSEKINYIDCLNNLEEINNDEAITNKKSSLVGQKKLAPKDDLGWLLLLFLWIANLICPCFLKESVRTRRKTTVVPVRSKTSM